MKYLFCALIASTSSALSLDSIKHQKNMEKFIDNLNSPEDLSNLQLDMRPKVADFDSVEDYVNYQDKSMDKFFKPARYNPVENLYNTRHGELPEHNQEPFDAKLTEPEDSYTLVRKDWNMH